MSEALGKLREYETIVVLLPDVGDDVAQGAIDRIREVLAKKEAELLREERWGKRKLAFEVKKQNRGNYVLFHYVGLVGVVEELERTLRNMEVVIRFLTTVHGEVTDVQARRAEVEKIERERAANRAKAEAERREREERESARAHDDDRRGRDDDDDEGQDDVRGAASGG
ncbi:MAG: 30S ribosomal protein S6 [Deltaproteobacteria bacterium]|nr:30S ribosomal protein S6 [Deltaproteobacteria bacterium]